VNWIEEESEKLNRVEQLAWPPIEGMSKRLTDEPPGKIVSARRWRRSEWRRRCCAGLALRVMRSGRVRVRVSVV